MKRTIITVVGKDIVGIIAKICTYLAENGINILDISQTIVQGYFNMMMIVDTSTLRPSRKLDLMGISMVRPAVLAMRPRIPASWRICFMEPRAPEVAII